MLPLTASLRYGSLGTIRLALGSPSFLAGVGSHRLTFPLEAVATWLEHEEPTATTPLFLTGAVWAELPSMQWLGSLIPQTLALRGYGAGEELSLDLSDAKLLAIEDLRGDHDDLRLQLKLQGTLLVPPQDFHPIAHEQAPVYIQQRRWTELLDQLGRSTSILLRLPSPLTDDGVPVRLSGDDDQPSLTRAVLRLRQARGDVIDRRYEACVAGCRLVLENLAQVVSLPSPKVVFQTKPEDRSQEQRWAAVYYDVKSLTSGSHHDDKATVGFDWTRTDAEVVLAATAGLLKRLPDGFPK